MIKVRRQIAGTLKSDHQKRARYTSPASQNPSFEPFDGKFCNGSGADSAARAESGNGTACRGVPGGLDRLLFAGMAQVGISGFPHVKARNFGRGPLTPPAKLGRGWVMARHQSEFGIKQLNYNAFYPDLPWPS